MLRSLIGPKYCGRLKGIFCCLFCVVLTVLLVYYMFPVVFGNIVCAILHIC